MEAFRDLKKAARQTLGGRWGRAAVILLLLRTPGLLAGITEQGIRMAGKLPAFLEGVFSPANPAFPSMAAALGCGLLCFLLWAPLRLGEIRWYWRANGGEREHLGALFHYFESYRGYLKSLGLTLLVILRVALWFLLFCLPAVLAGGFAFWQRYRFGPAELGAARPLFLLVLSLWPPLAALLAWIAGQRYFLAPRLLAQRPGDPVGRAVKKSVRLMRGWGGRVFLLRLSFWPWYLPGIAAAAAFVTALTPVMFREWYFWGAAGLAAVQALLGFYWKPLRAAALARCAGELLTGAVVRESDNVTREYFYKSGELTLPPMAGPAEPFAGRMAPEDR